MYEMKRQHLDRTVFLFSECSFKSKQPKLCNYMLSLKKTFREQAGDTSMSRCSETD